MWTNCTVVKLWLMIKIFTGISKETFHSPVEFYWLLLLHLFNWPLLGGIGRTLEHYNLKCDIRNYEDQKLYRKIIYLSFLKNGRDQILESYAWKVFYFVETCAFKKQRNNKAFCSPKFKKSISGFFLWNGR